MEKPRQELRVLIPSSVTSELGDKKIKTVKLGHIARSLSIFRVQNVTVYRTKRDSELDFIKKVLQYAETPPYLKKKLFGLSDDLRYVGVIPPLQTPHHNVTKEISEGEYREGMVVDTDLEDQVGSDYCARAYIGLDEPALLAKCGNISENKRITVRTVSCGDQVVVKRTSKDEVPYYWGYETKVSNHLDNELIRLKEKGWRIVSTSVYGEIVDKNSLEDHLSKKTAIIFGSPNKGVREYLEDPSIVDEEINTVPNQGTETVRTEEAIQSTLSIFNLVRK
ncbi:MAG: RNA methyltransferase SPOUT superfamily MTH1 [Candidatus Methanohalarchaeum thermophilum]|uniref:RNA methyltransferase SPOUT superfamily MTH1 n=1 Tax=Methanohalarchaeum thermophilum TaxID=1903181 RepID=A0A1Q6DX01_METT1|nr:MAG: RNA methyltransferase SPOUT superfamily MTH1 [Candidatus Methanohalarchaeum thermophilum]